jgi:CHAD domain-containing protein/adenylate cyclase class IV
MRVVAGRVGYRDDVRERETKFLIDPGHQLPAPDELLAGLGRYSVEEVDQDAIYFDTPDLRLTRAGASLRFRSDDGWTVKLPEVGGDTLVRDELTFGGDDAGGPPDDAVALVRALVRSAPLEPVAQVKTHRRKIHVCDPDGRPVGEIDDDEVRTSARAARPTRFHEIEFEVEDGADQRLVKAIVKRLRRLGAKPSHGLPKVARAFGGVGSGEPDLAPPDGLDPRGGLEALVRAAITASAHRLVTNDPVVRLGEDPEGVHQARVATRRLRSDLRTFRPVLDTDWSEPLRSELRWLGELLGGVRDRDVLRELLTARADALCPGQHARALSFVRRLDEQRASDRRALLDAMNSPRYLALLDQLVDAAHAPRLRAGKDARGHTRKRVAQLVRKPWRRLRDAIRLLPNEPPDIELHEVRKRAKQARYALEATAPVLGKPAVRVAKRLASLQDALGAHQDAVVAAAWLHDAALDSDDTEAAFVAGELAESFGAERRHARRTWWQHWKRAKRAHAKEAV